MIYDKVDDLKRIEEEIFEDLAKLENWSQECVCDDRTIVKIIHEGEFDEIITYCLE